MTLTLKTLGWLALCSAAGMAGAQQPTVPTTPAASAASAAPAAPPAAGAATTVTKPAKTTAQAEAGEPRADTSPAAREAPPPGTSRSRAAQKSPNAVDRLDLGTATVTGDREQPKVMYIVPWKRSDMGDMGGKPMNSLLDEVLAPVDREVFKRQVRYYEAVKADASQNGAPAPGSANQGEK
jgi:hypothetical protein